MKTDLVSKTTGGSSFIVYVKTRSIRIISIWKFLKIAHPAPDLLLISVNRHHRTNKSKHWHIDYLREHMDLTSVWYSYNNKKLEHQWAQALSAMADMDPIHGFGCSDCQCYSHLFRTINEPGFKLFSNKAGGMIKSYAFYE